MATPEIDARTLPVPLYHGTSTMFLRGIVDSGLAGANPIADWKLIEFSLELRPFAETHLAGLEAFVAKLGSFQFMVKQKSAAMNFQHGSTYLSPARDTAIRYAASNPFGSELLSCVLHFLHELVRRKVPGVCDDLYRRYPQIFAKLDLSPAPLLIQVNDVPTKALLSEAGSDATNSIERVRKYFTARPRDYELWLQQTNFRLSRPVPATNLRCWLVNVEEWHPAFPKYSLHALSMNRDA